MENQTTKQIDKKSPKQAARIVDVLAKLDIVLEELKEQRAAICQLQTTPNTAQGQLELLDAKMDNYFSGMAADMHNDFNRLLMVVGAAAACGLIMAAL